MKPSKPTGPLLITDVQKNSVKITWKPSEDDGGSPVTSYTVEKRSISSTYWSKVEKVKDSVTECSATNLHENTEYHFRVYAENKIGESESLETKQTTLVKSPFSKLKLFKKFSCFYFK